MKEQVEIIVKTALQEINSTLQNVSHFDLTPSLNLYGRNGYLDSLSLVSLIVTIEGAIEENFGISLILANERALSQHQSPFSTLGTLIQYVNQLVTEETNHE
jgi:D-alanine--poly(phosphoribitol) ligase subunit 2